MSKAAQRRRFLRWKKYRRQCTEVTGEQMSLTQAMSVAWRRAMYPVRGGQFYTLPPWHKPYIEEHVD